MPESVGQDGAQFRLEAILLAELDEVADDLRQAAAAAAVAGETFDLACGAAIAQLSQEQFGILIGQLVACDIVRPGPQADLFSFRHPLLRHIAYASARPGWLLGAHRRAEQYLTQIGCPLTARAPHLEVAAIRGDQSAARDLTAAAEQVIGQEPATAARWLSTALHALTGTGDDDLGLRYELAYALGVSGQLDESWKLLTDLLARADDPSLRRQAALFAAMLERHTGNGANARDLLVAALAEHSDSAAGGPKRSALSLELCYQNLLDANPAGLAEQAEQALLASNGRDDRMHRAAALGQLALARYYQADVPSARRHCAKARRLVDELPDQVISSELDACCYVAWSEVCLQFFQDALRHLDRALELAKSGGRFQPLPQILTLRSMALRRLGNITAAMECVDEALAAAEQAGSRRWRMTALAVRCDIAVAQGDLELAVAAGAEALALADRPVDQRIIQHVPACLAVARFLTGQTAGYASAVLDAFGGTDLPDLECGLRPMIYETLTWMAVIGGEVTQAGCWAERAVRSGAGLQLPYSAGYAHLAWANAHIAGQPERARAEAQHAARQFSDVGAAYEVGRATYTAGVAAYVLGQVDDAVKLISRAHELITDCGGARLFHKISEQVRLSAKDDGKADDLIGDCIELSARQEQIAGLVAKGLTNRQIARSLNVSEKTVETHLARTFAKLGVTNRAMLASSATRRTERRADLRYDGQGFP